ncbi:MAG TPA: radical SAM protein [Syntrophorhabdaceae bacterium]|nr:radical SAM protein [Syntrophorhabdaceae bacterium]MDI9559760.1 radical SAM protein [Pseudomonadota bacterium]HNZ59020.1 radical SAM protein [Syntrophorhabdaceae bacterium]HOG40133.1 radical SAM protein [Syntrophorhabdaceae bacterium]HPN98201.1 radical SAM protein [Syntrophorhabdaceae bacterium]
MGILNTLFRHTTRKRFSAWQIELTTLCPLQCTMCIKDEYSNWKRKSMVVDDFKKIVPYMKDVENVVLEGWGESLMHKDLIQCIHLVKKEGSRVGFVTSGSGLNDRYIAKLLETNLDFIGFSLSGATPETHNAIRVNSDFNTLINSIITLKKLSSESTPPNMIKMHIVYLMLKENIGELSLLLELASKIGIEEIILLNIVQVSNQSQYDRRVFDCNSKTRYKELIKQFIELAGKANIKVALPNLSPSEVPVCTENPLNNIYISVDGEVSPCVYLNPPVLSPFKRIFCGEEFNVKKVSFGNIFDEPFESIWNKKEYTDFRGLFYRRRKCFTDIYQSFLEMKKPEKTDFPQPPFPCRTCHKILGF